MTEIEKGDIFLKADFNSVRDGATIVARFDFGEHAAVLPNIGDEVVVRDPEGNQCRGEAIERVGDDRFRVRLDYSTWEDGMVVEPVLDLMEALRRSVAEVVDARDRHVAGTGRERAADAFTVSAA